MKDNLCSIVRCPNAAEVVFEDEKEKLYLCEKHFKMLKKFLTSAGHHASQ